MRVTFEDLQKKMPEWDQESLKLVYDDLEKAGLILLDRAEFKKWIRKMEKEVLRDDPIH